MTVTVTAVLASTAAQFVVGAIWYMVLFDKQWGEIHGFNKLDKKTQKEMRSKMGPYYAVQIAVTIMTAYVLAKLMVLLPAYSEYRLAFWVWFGLVLPTQASAVIFGGTEPKWIWQKIAIMSAGALACLLVAAYVLHAIMA